MASRDDSLSEPASDSPERAPLPIGDVAGDDEVRSTRIERVRYRRAPRLSRFMLVGAILGVVIAAVLTFIGPGSVQVQPIQVFALLALWLGFAGAALLAVIALVIDRFSSKRAIEVDSELTTVTRGVISHQGEERLDEDQFGGDQFGEGRLDEGRLDEGRLDQDHSTESGHGEAGHGENGHGSAPRA